MRGITAAAAGFAVGLVMLSACRASPPQERSLPSDSPASNGPKEPAKAAGLEWATFDRWPRSEHPQVATGRYVALRTSDSGSVVLRSSTNGRELFTYDAPEGFEISHVYLDPPNLVVVNSDKAERAGDRPVAINLESRAERELPESAPATWTGSSSYGQGVLTYGARGPKGRYCLARVGLKSLDGGLVECVPPRHGIHQVELSPFGVTYTTFDDAQPASCGTARELRGQGPPMELIGPRRCVVWQSIALPDGGAIWGEVPDPEQIELAHIFVRSSDREPEFLGEGTTGSLTWCGDSVWFVRQVEGQLMRWSQSRGLEEALSISGTSKVAVLGAPVCSGDFVSVAESSDAPGPGNKEVVYVARV